MLFGLTNVSITFWCCMDFVLTDLRGEGILIYINEILIHVKTFEELSNLISKVFCLSESLQSDHQSWKFAVRFSTFKIFRIYH